MYSPASGPFSETIRVEMESQTQSQKTTQLVVITGVSRPTFEILPPSLDVEIKPKTQTLHAFFEINLLNKNQWQEASVKSITLPQIKNPTDFLEISIVQGKSKSQFIGTCKFNLYKIIPKEVQLPISGFINLRFINDQKAYDIDYPISLISKAICFYPELIVLSQDKPTEILIEAPSDMQLEQIEVLPQRIPFVFTKEVVGKDGYSSLVLVKYDRNKTRLPAGFRFGILSFKFSNGQEVKKNLLVEDNLSKSNNQ